MKVIAKSLYIRKLFFSSEVIIIQGTTNALTVFLLRNPANLTSGGIKLFTDVNGQLMWHVLQQVFSRSEKHFTLGWTT